MSDLMKRAGAKLHRVGDAILVYGEKKLGPKKTALPKESHINDENNIKDECNPYETLTLSLFFNARKNYGTLTETSDETSHETLNKISTVIHHETASEDSSQLFQQHSSK